METLEEIRDCVEKAFDLDIESKCRKHSYINARWCYFQLCKMLMPLKNDSRTSSFIGFDHCTGIHYRNSTPPDHDLCMKFITDVLEGVDVEKMNAPEMERQKEKKYLTQKEKKIISLIKQNKYLKERLELYTKKPKKEEEELLTIFRGLSFAKKQDLLFKAKTALTIQKKMEA